MCCVVCYSSTSNMGDNLVCILFLLAIKPRGQNGKIYLSYYWTTLWDHLVVLIGAAKSGPNMVGGSNEHCQI